MMQSEDNEETGTYLFIVSLDSDDTTEVNCKYLKLYQVFIFI